MTYCYSQALKLADGDTIKTIKTIRGSLYAAFELTKVIKCSPKRERAFSRLRKDNVAGNFGGTILCPNC